jgi:hypothetical protein
MNPRRDTQSTRRHRTIALAFAPAIVAAALAVGGCDTTAGPGSTMTSRDTWLSGGLDPLS